MTTAPTQVLSQRLPATPEQVWARVWHSAFIADYLGATLPAVPWPTGQSLQGTGPDGAPLAVTVIAALAPCSLSLRVCSGQQHLGLQVSIAACAGGSRLTLLHEAVSLAGDRPAVTEATEAVEAAATSATAGARAGTAQVAGLVPGTRAGAQFGAQFGSPRAIDPRAEPGAGFHLSTLARGLAAPPGLALSASALSSLPALAAARAYLADTATLVAALRSGLPPRQGFALPADGGFSLAQHVWHLADVEQFGWARRFDRLLGAHNPLLPGVDGDRLAIERRYQHRRWHPAAGRFVRQRQHTLAALAHCTPATLQRPVRFSGQATIGAEMLAALLAHDQEHRLDLAQRLFEPEPDRWPEPATPA